MTQDILASFNDGDDVPFDEAVHDLEESIKRECEQIEIPVKHYILNGLYAREIVIPPGVVVTGAIHKHEHLNIISKGKIAVVTAEGRKIVEAPATIISPPGTKRAGLTLDETVWTTISAVPHDEEFEIEHLEKMLVCETKEDYERYLESDEVKRKVLARIEG